jgi:hypothetical protein
MGVFRKMMAGFGAAFHALLPSCRDAARLQSDAMERPVAAARKPGLWFHLLICGWCRRYGRQIRFLCRAAEEHPERFVEAGAEELKPEARERIKRKIRAGGG